LEPDVSSPSGIWFLYTWALLMETPSPASPVKPSPHCSSDFRLGRVAGRDRVRLSGPIRPSPNAAVRVCTGYSREYHGFVTCDRHGQMSEMSDRRRLAAKNRLVVSALIRTRCPSPQSSTRRCPRRPPSAAPRMPTPRRPAGPSCS
jgi:hypothetical protein